MTSLASLLSPVTWLNAVAGSTRVAETHDVAFGPGPRDRLDIYAPVEAEPGSCPTMVFFYGGGWEDGHRDAYRFVGAALASRGIVTVIPDYRVYPEALFPAFIEDGARAVRWTIDTITRYGGDPKRLVLAGHSAGAHIAAMLNFDGQWLGAVGLDPRRDIRGLVGLAGPYDFLPLHSERLETIFGPEPGRGASQPINFVSEGAPPALLITGDRDTVVDPGNSPRLAASIRRHAGIADVRIYARVTHEALVGAFARPLRFVAPVLRDTVAFVARVAGISAPAPADAEVSG